MSQKRTGKRGRMYHKVNALSLVRIACACGWSWRNDLLKGKTDEKLEDERDAEFKAHIKTMEREGF